MENLEILQKLYSLQHSLIDLDEIEIIRKLISKRKIEINVLDTYSYTKRELSRMTNGVRNEMWNAINYCGEVYNIEVNWSEEFESELKKIYNKFEILKLKINKQKNTLISRTAKENLKIIMKEEFIKLIIKYQKL
jgi:hypothetical protein